MNAGQIHTAPTSRALELVHDRRSTPSAEGRAWLDAARAAESAAASPRADVLKAIERAIAEHEGAALDAARRAYHAAGGDPAKSIASAA